MELQSLTATLGYMPAPLVKIVFGYADDSVLKLYQEILVAIFGYQEPIALAKRVYHRVFSKTPKKVIDYNRALNLLEKEFKNERETDTPIHEILKVLLGRLYFVRGNLQCDSRAGQHALQYWEKSIHPFRYYYLVCYYNAKSDVAATTMYGDLAYKHITAHLQSREFVWFPEPLRSQHEAWCHFMLGVLLRDGFVKQKDEKQSMKYFRLAAEHHHSQAQVHVGYGLFNGIGVDQGRHEACLWFERSAEQGDSEAQRNLGTCYQGGAGVLRNLTQAKKYYQQACEQGEALAYISLGDLYFRGSGVAIDYKKAINLYQQAAAKGEAAGYHNLAVIHERGLVGEKDIRRALEFYNIAAGKGAEEAKRAIQRLRPL
eukprot:TRINITY_DN7140_c0_g1_i2.p1 TRINITY_DN7140_c0_g1~~TRINITY_DN7140_c0_g1_i2.p1  ORF type:complete len:372 (+),score=51.65 TRINITY_DN7140_c0_g1_i2:144-1259(+)